jgi:hypothetical protein
MRSLAILLLAAASSAAAQSSLDLGDRRLDVIDDPIQIVFRAPAAMDRIRAAIETSRGWAAVPQGPGRWELTRDEAGRHQAKVALLCDTASCSIQYLDSMNLMYRGRQQSGSPLRAVHKTYNTWVRDLAKSLAGAIGGASVVYGYAPLADAEAIPFIDSAGRKAYLDWLGKPKPRAFAIGLNGAWGWSAPIEATYLSTRLDVVGRAMERCERRGEGSCSLYAVDERVVWEPR